VLNADIGSEVPRDPYRARNDDVHGNDVLGEWDLIERLAAAPATSECCSGRTSDTKHEPHPGRYGRYVYAMIVVDWLGRLD
jgi:hypothetical protein